MISKSKRILTLTLAHSPSQVRLKRSDVRECLPVDTLGFATVVKSQVRSENDLEDKAGHQHLARPMGRQAATHDPSDQSSRCTEVVQPVEDLSSSSRRASAHERQKTQTRGERHGPDRKSTRGTFSENLGRLAFERKGEEGSGGGVLRGDCNDILISYALPPKRFSPDPALTTSELAADQAAIKTIALTIEGKTLIPAFDTAIVNGLDAALPVSLNNLGSL